MGLFLKYALSKDFYVVWFLDTVFSFGNVLKGQNKSKTCDFVDIVTPNEMSNSRLPDGSSVVIDGVSGASVAENI